MLHRRSLLLAAPSIVLAGTAFGQTQPTPAPSAPDDKTLLVSSGSKSGTYYRIIEEFRAANPGILDNEESNGSLTNISRVVNNKAELGIAQLDALVLLGQREQSLKERTRVVQPLFLEEVHFIAKAAGREEGGVGAFGYHVGATKVVFHNIEDLKGHTVGFWGGSAITEQIISAMALIGWQSMKMPDQDTAMAALKSDQIDAVLAVGGQPLGWVSSLDQSYKLLEVPDSTITRLAAVYERANLNYNNLGQEGVQTLAVRAMLFSQHYKGRTKVAELLNVRKHFADSIEDIRETRGTHPKWNEIQPNATTDKWPMITASAS